MVAADHVECGCCLVIGSRRIRHGPANLDTDQNENMKRVNTFAPPKCVV